MAKKREKLLIALSGGIDSATSAALLQERGFDCTGVFMVTNDQYQSAQVEAERIADKLGIKLHVLDLRRDFEQILDYFCSEYGKGRTPNPCVVCNRHIKFGKLWDFARDKGAAFFATGHYARVIKSNDQPGLYEAANTNKDQSYVLAMIDKSILGHIILPMGSYSKEQTHRMAAEFGLVTERKEESQEICFIPENDYAVVLERLRPELVRKGNIVDSSGKILGLHKGVHKFTIGQRRGLGVAMGEPYYVVKIDAGTNTIALGTKEELMHRRLTATQVNWLIDKPAGPFQANVKIRYNDKGSAATVSPQVNSVLVEFDEPISAITPGQLAVFYIQQGGNNRVVGGGWIEGIAD